MAPRSKINSSPTTISYAALETRGKHPTPGALHLSLKERATAVVGIEETTNHLVLGFSDQDKREAFLKGKEIHVAGTRFPIKPWPLTETIKVRLKKVGLEATSEDIVKEIRKSGVPLKKVILETCNEAPNWRNGNAHFFINKELVSKLPNTISVKGRTVRPKVMPKKDSPPTAAPQPIPKPEMPQNPIKNATTNKPLEWEKKKTQSKGVASTPSSSQPMMMDPKPSVAEKPFVPPPEDPRTPDRTGKKRKVISPLSKRTEACPTISPKHLKDLGVPLPTCPGVLSIYESVSSQEEALQQAKKFPTKLKGETDRTEVWADKTEGDKKDLFVFQHPKDRSVEPVAALMEEVANRLPPEVLTTGMVQFLDLPGDVTILVLFKSRIVQHYAD